MGEFTPGPWRTVEYGYEKHSITDDRGAEIGFAHRRRDARLIAAAPKLYEAGAALSNHLDQADASFDADPSDSDFQDGFHAALSTPEMIGFRNALRAALAKARGEQ